MPTLPWLLTLLLASLEPSAVKAEDQRTTCISSTVAEGERAVITYHLRPDIDYSTSLLYIRRDQKPGQILICDGTCDVKNGHFRSTGIVGTTLTLEAPAVTPEEQGRYYLFAVVDGQQQTPCACNLTVVAKAAVPPPAEDGTNVTKVAVVVGLLGCFAIGVCLLLYFLVIKRRRHPNVQYNVPKGDLETGSKRNVIPAGAGDDTTKEPETEGERDELLSNNASDPTPPLVSTRQPDTGLSSTAQAPGVDELARTDLRVKADVVSSSHVQATESSVDATKPRVEESAASLQADKVPGKAKRVSSDAVGHTGGTVPDAIVDFNGPNEEERPASLLEDKGKLETVRYLIESFRSTATQLKKIMSQHPDVKDVALKDKIQSLREQRSFTETNVKWDSIRREIAQSVNLTLSDYERKEAAKLLVKGSRDKDKLVPELSAQVRLFKCETNRITAETEKTFATFSAYRDFDVVCLCLSLHDMLDMSVRMRDDRYPKLNSMLDRVADEIESLTKQSGSTHRVSLC